MIKHWCALEHGGVFCRECEASTIANAEERDRILKTLHTGDAGCYMLSGRASDESVLRFVAKLRTDKKPIGWVYQDGSYVKGENRPDERATWMPVFTDTPAQWVPSLDLAEVKSLTWLDRLCTPDQYLDRLGPIRDWVHRVARKIPGSPVPGGLLNTVETHPNYVLGFKTGHTAARERNEFEKLTDEEITEIIWACRKEDHPRDFDLIGHIRKLLKTTKTKAKVKT